MADTLRPTGPGIKGHATGHRIASPGRRACSGEAQGPQIFRVFRKARWARSLDAPQRGTWSSNECLREGQTRIQLKISGLPSREAHSRQSRVAPPSAIWRIDGNLACGDSPLVKRNALAVLGRRLRFY